MIVGHSLVALVALVNGFAVARNIPCADEIDKASEDPVSTRCLTHRDPASTHADLETRWSTHHQCTKTCTDTTTCTSTPSVVIKALTTTSTITLRAPMAISVATVTRTTTSTSSGSTTITQTSTYTATATSTYTSTVPTRSGFEPIQSSCPDSSYNAGTSNSEIATRDEKVSVPELQHAPEGLLNRTSNSSTADAAAQAHLIKGDDVDDGLSLPEATWDINDVKTAKHKIPILEAQLAYLIRFLPAGTRLVTRTIFGDSRTETPDQPQGSIMIPMELFLKLKDLFKPRPIITQETLNRASTNNSTTKSLQPRKLPQDHLHLQHGVLCEEWPPRGKCTTVTTTCTKVIPAPTPTSSTTSTIILTAMITPSTTLTSTLTVTVSTEVIQTMVATTTATSTTTEVITPATVQTVHAACATANFANKQVSTGKYIGNVHGSVVSGDYSFEYTNAADCCNWGFQTHGDELGLWLFTPNSCRLFYSPSRTACTNGQAGVMAQAEANLATTTGAYVVGNGYCGAVVRIF